VAMVRLFQEADHSPEDLVPSGRVREASDYSATIETVPSRLLET
jgi:hypothetical protein